MQYLFDLQIYYLAIEMQSSYCEYWGQNKYCSKNSLCTLWFWRAAHAGFLHSFPSIIHSWPFILRACARFSPQRAEARLEEEMFINGYAPKTR